MNCAIDSYQSNHYGRKCLSNLLQLEPCSDMFKVISDIMAHSYEMWNIISAINFWIANKMDCAFLIIISNYYVTKCLCYQLQLDTCNVMFKVISDMLAHRYDMRNTFIIAIYFCNAKEINSALMFINAIIMEENVLVIYYS